MRPQVAGSTADELVISAVVVHEDVAPSESVTVSVMSYEPGVEYV
jgi:hypothetical protein